MKIHVTTALLLAAAAPALGAELVNVTTDKAEYLVYEPVYLTMELVPGQAPPGFRFGPLEDLGITMALQITDPRGQTFHYRPPMRLERFARAQAPVEYARLILHRGSVITAQPGQYGLQLVDPTGKPVSRKITITAASPTGAADTDAVDTIRQNPRAYGMFIYLEGGDHIADGHRIVRKLAGAGSRYAPTARAVLAINYSQDSFDMATGSMRRAKDARLSAAHFPSASDPAPLYLKLKAARMARAQFLTLPSDMAEKIQHLDVVTRGKVRAGF